MSENRVADQSCQPQGDEQSFAQQTVVHFERRREPRVPPRTLEDAHAIVESIAKRRVENDGWVRRWRSIERSVYLLALAGAFLLYYLIDKMNEAMSLPSLGF